MNIFSNKKIKYESKNHLMETNILSISIDEITSSRLYENYKDNHLLLEEDCKNGWQIVSTFVNRQKFPSLEKGNNNIYDIEFVYAILQRNSTHYRFNT